MGIANNKTEAFIDEIYEVPEDDTEIKTDMMGGYRSTDR